MAALFEFDRKDHQLINMKDMIPTPSQPMKNWNRFSAVTRITITRVKVVSWLKKVLIFRSDSMYCTVNSMIAHTTKSRMGKKKVE